MPGALCNLSERLSDGSAIPKAASCNKPQSQDIVS